MLISKTKVSRMNEKKVKRYNISIQYSLTRIIHMPPRPSIFSIFSDKMDDGIYKKT